MKEWALQPIAVAESSQVVKESASQPNVIAEGSQVQHATRFQDPRVSAPKEFALFLRKISPKISQIAKEDVVKVLTMKMKWSFVFIVRVPGQIKQLEGKF